MLSDPRIDGEWLASIGFDRWVHQENVYSFRVENNLRMVYYIELALPKDATFGWLLSIASDDGETVPVESKVFTHRSDVLKLLDVLGVDYPRSSGL